VLADAASMWEVLLMPTCNPSEAQHSSPEPHSALFTVKRKRGQCGGWASEAIVFLCQLFVVVAIGLLLALYMLECAVLGN